MIVECRYNWGQAKRCDMGGAQKIHIQKRAKSAIILCNRVFTVIK